MFIDTPCFIKFCEVMEIPTTGSSLYYVSEKGKVTWLDEDIYKSSLMFVIGWNACSKYTKSFG